MQLQLQFIFCLFAMRIESSHVVQSVIRVIPHWQVGEVTSGTMSPCLKTGVSMAYVSSAFAKEGTKLKAIVRGKPIDATVCKMPFVPNRYYKKP
jgi:glycine cleavage system aminomethyltransferase T